MRTATTTAPAAVAAPTRTSDSAVSSYPPGVPDATHACLLEAEADAAAASQAIRDVVTSVRTHRPLR